jgi:transcriptional antiterminator RfaH
VQAACKIRQGFVQKKAKSKRIDSVKLVPEATSRPATAVPLTEAQWFVLYTKARCEKKVAEGLKQKGLEVYCPMLKTKRRWSDRLKTVEEPLLRSYCFVRLEERDRHLVFSVQHVVRYLFWLGKPAVVRDEEIEALQLLLNGHDHELLLIRNLDIKDRIRIKSGPMNDLEGEITQKRGKVLQVYIEALQLVVSVDSRKSLLEKVG